MIPYLAQEFASKDYKTLAGLLRARQKSIGVCCDYSMRQIVFFTFVSLCSAELGYHYQPNAAGLGFETNAELSNNQAIDHYQEHADYHKHFYAFEAPYDSSDESDQVEQKISALAKKNLQVVFIKAPENKAVDGALHALAKQTNEDKTAIYVLNKQTDPHELAGKLSVLRTQHKHKPQVHFVKYRTEEEAALAQQQIQAQYGGAQSSESLLGYSQPAELPPQGYYTDKQPLAPQGYYPQELAAAPPPPHPSYLPPTPSFGSLPLPYNGGAEQGNIDLPPLPLPEQQLSPSPYDLDARTAKLRRSDFRVNERHRPDSRMVFPTGTPHKSYLPAVSNSYLTAQKRRRRAHF